MEGTVIAVITLLLCGSVAELAGQEKSAELYDRGTHEGVSRQRRDTVPSLVQTEPESQQNNDRTSAFPGITQGSGQNNDKTSNLEEIKQESTQNIDKTPQQNNDKRPILARGGAKGLLHNMEKLQAASIAAANHITQIQNTDITQIQNTDVVQVPEEYIFTIKPPIGQRESYFRDYRDELSKMAAVRGWFEFGSLAVAVVKSDEVTAAEFSHSPHVTIEANFNAVMVDSTDQTLPSGETTPTRFSTSSEASSESTTNSMTTDAALECLTQVTGPDLWGLGRLGYRGKPDYHTSVYTSMSGDGEDTFVYIIDSGIYTQHRDFEGRAVHGFTASAIKQQEGDEDLSGHGTHCAGIAIGRTYGVAKSANAIAVKVLNSAGAGNVSSIIEGLHWVYHDYVNKSTSATYRAVLSMSLMALRSTALDNAVQECLDAGLVTVAASGNFGMDACSFSPGAMQDVITVSATDQNDKLAWFSNYGTCVDILAPGMDILSTHTGDPSRSTKLNGTSMAAPFVSGAILRYLSQVGPASPGEIKQWLKSTATNLNQSDPIWLLYADCSLVDNERTTDVPDGNDATAKNLLTTVMPLLIILHCFI